MSPGHATNNLPAPDEFVRRDQPVTRLQHSRRRQSQPLPRYPKKCHGSETPATRRRLRQSTDPQVTEDPHALGDETLQLSCRISFPASFSHRSLHLKFIYEAKMRPFWTIVVDTSSGCSAVALRRGPVRVERGLVRLIDDGLRLVDEAGQA